MESTTSPSLHMLFFPFMARGHMLPMVDMAKVFATRGVAVTILTTPGTYSMIRTTIDRFNSSAAADISATSIHLHFTPFPSSAAGLPDGCEDISIIFKNAQLIPNFMNAIEMLCNSFDAVVKDLRPDCVVSDVFLPRTHEIAARNNVPRISFNGSNFFAQCATESMERHQILQNLPPEADASVVIPDFPHHIQLLRSQIRDFEKISPSMLPAMKLFKDAKEVSLKSYGTVVNSFLELEPDYVEQFRKVVGLKAWHVGPVALSNRDAADKLVRGGENREECLQWLDGRKPGSVLYVCFGSGGEFTAAQLREIAAGLEDSGHPFIWVTRSRGEEEWIAEGYEERIEGRGAVIRGWAPQLSILDHESVGGFVTHCGWNSSLEGICAGLPMATWPLFAEQFFNEKLLVDVLRIGVAVGSKVNGMMPEDRPVVAAAALEEAVRRVMGEGEEAEERRRRARELKEMARRAVEAGGSSYDDIGSLIQELRERKKKAF